MSTCNNATTTIQPDLTKKFIQTFGQGVVPLVNKRGCHGAVMRERFGRRVDQFGASFRECWRRMRAMHAAFEQSSDGARSRERSEERLRDEESWSRMDDEGCPNGRQQPEAPQDIIEKAKRLLRTCSAAVYESSPKNPSQVAATSARAEPSQSYVVPRVC